MIEQLSCKSPKKICWNSLPRFSINNIISNKHGAIFFKFDYYSTLNNVLLTIYDKRYCNHEKKEDKYLKAVR